MPKKKFPGLSIAAAASRWETAKLAADEARQDLIDAVVEALAGGMSEYEAARQADVTRVTIRTWRGKS